MLIQPTLESLQEKYSKHLKGEVIQDFIPVTYKSKKSNLVLTQTRLICLQNEISDSKPHFTLQNQSIEQIIYTSYSLTIKYPRSAAIKVSFGGLNPHHKNQAFVKKLPKSQLHKANAAEILIVLGGGAALILLLVIGAITNPRSYADNPRELQEKKSKEVSKFMSACETALKAQLTFAPDDYKIDYSSAPFAQGSLMTWASSIDMKNAFNTTVRNHFICEETMSGANAVIIPK
jgi:hypothetical protein